MSYGYRQPWQSPLHGKFFGGTELIAVAAIAATVISTGVAVYGQMQAASAKSDASNYAAQVAANNAKISEKNAQYAEQAGAAQEDQQALKTRSLVGQTVAAQASSGLDVNSGSNLDVRSSVAALGEESSLTIKNSAARQAYGYRTQGLNYEAQAGLDRQEASNAMDAGAIGAAGALAGGIGSAGNMYAKDVQTGIFPPLVR